MENWWKYLIVSVASLIVASLFWTLTDFWRTTKIVNLETNFDAQMQLYKDYLEKEEQLEKNYQLKLKELGEKFGKPMTEEETCDGLDSLLDIHRECGDK